MFESHTRFLYLNFTMLANSYYHLIIHMKQIGNILVYKRKKNKYLDPRPARSSYYPYFVFY